jgi:hypothetical protein
MTTSTGRYVYTQTRMFEEDRRIRTGEKVLATLLSSSRLPHPSQNRRLIGNLIHWLGVSGKSPGSNKLVVETVMEQFQGT